MEGYKLLIFQIGNLELSETPRWNCVAAYNQYIIFGVVFPQFAFRFYFVWSTIRVIDRKLLNAYCRYYNIILFTKFAVCWRYINSILWFCISDCSRPYIYIIIYHLYAINIHNYVKYNVYYIQTAGSTMNIQFIGFNFRLIRFNCVCKWNRPIESLTTQ